MANDYITRPEVIEAMPDVSLGTTYDTLLDMLITRASRLIDGHLKRRPGAFYASTDDIYYYTGSGNAELWIDELADDPTSIYVAEEGDLSDYTLWASSDYFMWPDNAELDGVPYQRIDIDNVNGAKDFWPSARRAVKITGKFGFSTTPPVEIKQACIIQVVRWFKRGQQSFKDVGAITELGQLSYVKDLDPDVRQILELPKFQRITI